MKSEKKNAGGLDIKAMQQDGALLALSGVKEGNKSLQGVGTAVAGGMDRQTGRFVDGEQRLVAVENGQRRCHARRSRQIEGQGHPVPAGKKQPGTPLASAIDKNPAAVEGPLDGLARNIAESPDDEPVEALPRGCGLGHQDLPTPFSCHARSPNSPRSSRSVMRTCSRSPSLPSAAGKSTVR